MRRNSLDLNSLRADCWRRSIKSSPLSSTTSSLICSVVFCLISFISSSLLAIITTDVVRFEEEDSGTEHMLRWGRWMPLKDDLGNGFWRKEMGEEEEAETLRWRLSILQCQCRLPSLHFSFYSIFCSFSWAAEADKTPRPFLLFFGLTHGQALISFFIFLLTEHLFIYCWQRPKKKFIYLFFREFTSFLMWYISV